MLLSPGGHTCQLKGNNLYYKAEIVYKCFIKSLKCAVINSPPSFWFLAITLRWMKSSGSLEKM
jgi:hypothetical protein